MVKQITTLTNVFLFDGVICPIYNMTHLCMLVAEEINAGRDENQELRQLLNFVDLKRRIR